MFKLAVNRLWIGEYSGISAVALKEHWFWRSGSLAKVSQKQSFPLKFWWGQSQDEAGEKVCVSSVRFVVCIVVLVWITFLKDSSWIFRENSPCEFNSKLGNRALIPLQFSSVQSFSSVRLFATPWISARQGALSITISRSSLRFTSIESVMPSSHLILYCPLFFLPPIPPSIRVFSNESTLRMRWPKYWSFSFSIIPSNGHPGLVSFRMY